MLASAAFAAMTAGEAMARRCRNKEECGLIFSAAAVKRGIDRKRGVIRLGQRKCSP